MSDVHSSCASPACASCSRCDQCQLAVERHQVVMPTPCAVGGLLAIGEAPGADEDRLGEGFVGRAGKTLDSLLAVHGIGRDQYGRANIVRCRPPGNRKPNGPEVAACLPKLADFIESVRPRVLLLVGGTPSGYFTRPGSLSGIIKDGIGHIDAGHCHPALRRLAGLGIAVVAMPHTSPLAWNRRAPDGVKWAEIGAAQVVMAVGMLQP